MPDSRHNGVRAIPALVHELRANKPTLEELPFEPTDREVAKALASQAVRFEHIYGRLADALESMDATMLLILRQRMSAGVPWPVFVSFVAFALIAVVFLGIMPHGGR